MALNHRKIADDIIAELYKNNINSENNNEETETAKMIRNIVKHVINAILRDAKLTVNEITVNGAGNMGAPVISKLSKPGKVIIK